MITSATVSGAGRPTVAFIDTGALAHNFRLARTRAGERMILAVVKARAYGHGAVPVARVLIEQGADCLGVALVEEGCELREAGISAPVLVMGALFPEQADEIVRLGLTPVLTSLSVGEAVAAAARQRGCEAAVQVKVDTGMGRIGVDVEHAPDLVARLHAMKGVRVEGLMTHFADADLRDEAFAALQVARFEEVLDRLTKQGIVVPQRHAANSAALLDRAGSLFTMARPGLMLYGYDPREPGTERADLRPVLSLLTRIAFLKRVSAGVPISYGRTFVTKRESLIATIPIGYADGFSRALSNRGSALVRGVRVPVVGRVCMDMTMLDVTDVPGVREGDEVVLIGSQGNERITAEDIAGQTGTIPYEVLCGISGRVPRILR